MRTLPEHMEPHAWIDHVFRAQTALRGGVVRRRVRDIERLVGRELFLEEVERRGFQAVENNEHFVVFCNQAPIRRLL